MTEETTPAPGAGNAGGADAGRPSLYLEVSAERQIRVGGEVIELGAGEISL